MQALQIRFLPEIRIAGYVFFTVILFLFGSLTLYVFLFCFLCLAALAVPFRVLKSGFVPISLFLLFTFISNLLNQPGKIAYSVGCMTITEEGIRIAIVRTARIFLLIAGVKIFIASARTEDMVDAIGRVMSPLERVGIPVKDFFHTMGLTVSCFPLLKRTASEQFREHHQKDAVCFLDRARMLSSFLIPFFLRSLQSPEIFFQQRVDGNE